MKTQRLTVGQAVVSFLASQYSERDGVERRFFPGVFGIFGHGNVAGLGPGAAPGRATACRFYLARNEQAMVHLAAAYAKMANRLATLACTTSIGPGATNMLTAAAGATINRLPVLLLPGDIFATRRVAPVLQQLESAQSQDVSVNDAFRPVSRYWDRIYRPEQLVTVAPRGHARPDQPRGHGRGDAGHAPGRAGGGLRLSGRALRQARVARPARRCRSRRRCAPRWR